MIWGDGSPEHFALAVLWCACGVVIGTIYVFRIGLRVIRNNKHSVTRRIWGTFIFFCGVGHPTMVYYMAFDPGIWFFHWVVIPIEVLTMAATVEAGYRSPDVPT